LSALAEHGKKKKVRRTGRHSAPSQVEKIARQAGRAAPAVAVLGVLATGTQAHNLALAAPRPSAGQLATGPTGALVSDQVTSENQIMTGAPVSPGLYKNDTYRPRRAKPVRTGHSASALPATASHSADSRPVGRHRSPTPPPADACTGPDTGMLPANYAEIFTFLTSRGYSGDAAAGIAGNIYQESAGNPESGGGLIGWTPLPAGYVTGDAAADLDTQLNGILAFNQVWAQYIPTLNAAGSAADAAEVYMTYFERPGLPELANREAAATAVAAACGL
jgi:Phage tail lysozyme